MSGTIGIEDLHVGDILLCAGEGCLSEGIAKLDGGPYSHAALFVGEIDGTLQIVEAGLKGVWYHDLRDRIRTEVHTDAYRWHARDGATLGSVDYPVGPILDRAAKYIGDKYAHVELIFVAMLLLAKDAQVDKRKRWIMAIALDLLNKMIEHGTRPVVCSELVYRCYREAGAKYAIDVKETFLQVVESSLSHVTEESVKRHLEKKGHDLARIAELGLHRRPDLKKDIRDALKSLGSEFVIADFVSPNMLARASDLQLIGRLK